MWGQKAARIAELEARLTVALRDREPAVDATQDNALRSELAGARAAVRARDGRLALLQQQVDQLIARLGEYANRGIANGQQAERNRAAWLSARRRAQAYGDSIVRLVGERDTYQDWFDAEQAAHEEHRRSLAILLDLPAHADWLKVTRRLTEIVRERQPEVAP